MRRMIWKIRGKSTIFKSVAFSDRISSSRFDTNEIILKYPQATLKHHLIKKDTNDIEPKLKNAAFSDY